ncbi:endolytic transglycosylase MltG [Rhizobium leguminosarum]|uniref:Endolytic murein transglycosylase n=1 Tax=Rhizobium leguminosarum bv. trifolii (strain WSM1325) TaxID=395491 RepID=C6ATM2_RHILS|nr:endolytic transglycosylase MltG [Rhizobium leguminosarum]ACS55498.1 aminodeoxychorismate lyase [Rhizobium leguminosarum bv. trifolii WSM1325]MBY2913553.1 endolytic transglycosylase MltG [Rhizobium leguminosarum]MBY2931978.1 endolytic transglycosylase MltG [Rhizobium leguminosarum]MBY2969090.1 endolytic transglycosylase MltG [Rhizobium leguminosarum]MBY2976464.1 endolytic transglycosylase MltG [Rhizobium leguminosarum]
MSDTTNQSNDTQAQKGPIIPKSPSEALRPERVPEPPKRSKKARGQVVLFLNFIMTLAVLVCVVAIIGFYYATSTYRNPGPLQTNTNFIVRNGAGLTEIASNLERNAIISDARIFRYLTATHLSAGESLKAGEYEIKARASMRDIMELLKSGKSILYSVSFPEGLTVRQMFDRMLQDTVLEGDLPAALPTEGSLRPDTYKFSRGTKRSEIIEQMAAAQQKLVDQIWDKRDSSLPLRSKEEFVTLASIVEKETGVPDERAHVASVFLNRLGKGMRLQSDPTIIYGLFGGEGKPADRPIYQSDLKRDTPYNTYVIKGLPPTPIANPGKDALEAVANPWKTQDLYFVADGSGGHVFAATLEEHNANVKRWRKLEADKGSDPNIAVDGQPEEQPADSGTTVAPPKKKKIN